MKSTVRNNDIGGRPRGFTMVEVIVVLVIIAVLAAVLAPNVSRYMDRAKGQSAARDVTSTLRMARNEAMSRGEIILADVDTFQDDSDGNGRVTLYRTDTSGNAAFNCDPTQPNDTDCFAQSCAQATALGTDDLDDVRELRLGQNSPDMLIIDMEPAPSGGGIDGMLCFSPSGRVLSSGGLPLSSGGDGNCDEIAVRLWVRERDREETSVSGLKENPLGGVGLAECVTEDDYEAQRQGRQVANFWEIEIPYNGSITMEQ